MARNREGKILRTAKEGRKEEKEKENNKEQNSKNGKQGRGKDFQDCKRRKKRILGKKEYQNKKRQEIERVGFKVNILRRQEKDLQQRKKKDRRKYRKRSSE